MVITPIYSIYQTLLLWKIDPIALTFVAYTATQDTPQLSLLSHNGHIYTLHDCIFIRLVDSFIHLMYSKPP